MLAVGAVLRALARTKAEEPVYGADRESARVRPLAARNEEDATAAATTVDLTNVRSPSRR